MNFISKRYKFYSSAILIIIVVNLLLYILFGTYFEEYEGILSSLIHGTYTNYAVNEWNVDTHFLLFWLYATINQYFPNIQIYGFVLYALNWVGLLCFGLVLFRILYVNIKNESKVLFLLLYSIIAVDYTVNLGTTRIAFMLVVTIFAFVQSYLDEKKKIRLFHWIFLFVLFLLISLMRTEIVLLTTLCYIALLIIHVKLYKQVFLFLFIASTVYVVYNIVAVHFLSEARQVYYFKEFDFIDRDNINYKHLTKLQLLDVTAFKQYIISDKEHFTLKFYDAIANDISRFNVNSMIVTLTNSIKAFRISWVYVLLAFISNVLLFFKKMDNKMSRFLHVLFCMVFPVLLCMYLTIPQRFLVFYYSVVSIVNIVLISDINSIKRPAVYICLVFLLQILFSELSVSKKYKAVDRYVQTASSRLKLLSDSMHTNKPIVINTMEYMGRYFPVKPLGKFEPQNAVFLNFWYFGSYSCYTDKWKSLCNGNPLSLEEKMNYIILSKRLFITDDKTFDFLKNYLYLKYKIKIKKNDIATFDGDLKLCKLTEDI